MPQAGASAPREADSAQLALNAYAERVTANAGTSFYWGMRILPRARREAMYAIYAFCRAVDDIADGPDAPQLRVKKLGDWRAEVDRVFAGDPRTMTGRALTQPVRNFALAREDFLAVIDGVAMDAREEMRAPALADLKLYMSRVAGAVGLLSIRAFGDARPRARDLALALGEALQLTNILRDLREDAARGRLYLPRELLDKYGIAAREPAEVLAHPNLPPLCEEIAGMARAKFADAEAALGDCDRRKLRPAVIMMTIYRRLLDKLVRRGWRRLDERVEVAKPEKLWIALRHGLL